MMLMRLRRLLKGLRADAHDAGLAVWRLKGPRADAQDAHGAG